jgi:uncharacterized membrane protein YbhN (UPF0104 family)
MLDVWDVYPLLLKCVMSIHQDTHIYTVNTVVVIRVGDNISYILKILTLWVPLSPYGTKLLDFYPLAQQWFIWTLISLVKCIRGNLVWKVSFDGWMLDILVVRDEQPIHTTSTHPYITRAAGTQVVNSAITFKFVLYFCMISMMPLN